MRPGTVVTVVDTPSTTFLPTDTGTAFAVGFSDRGPLVPVLVSSLSAFVNSFGTRQTYSSLYDFADVFFKEGGSRLYVSRVVGPAPTTGTRTLLDGGAAVSLTVNANGPGAWSANYKVAVVAGGAAGTYRIQVTDAGNVVLEDSGDLYDQNSAVLWSQFSQYVRIVLGVSANNPAVVAPVALSAGNDDRTNATDTQWLDALNRINRDLGPGQITAPGRTTDTGHSQLLDHAVANNRAAVLDYPNVATQATLIASAAAAGGSGGKRFAAGFAPWVVVPGVTAGTLRTVPPSAFVCGAIARNEASRGPNRPSAGNNGESRYVTDLSQIAWDDTTIETLNAAGVNVIRRMFNGIRIYGWRSLANPVTDGKWLDFGNSRLIMAMKAEFAEIGENYLFEEIDGLEGQTIGGFRDALAAVCNEHWIAGDLFGSAPNEAFSVDMSENTTVTMAALELHAKVQVKTSPFAEYIPITIVKRDLTEVI